MSRQLSRHQLYFLGEPFGESATSTTVTGKRIYGGGGGGSKQSGPSKAEKRLFSAQADALEQMTDTAMPMLRTGMGNLGEMANESMDGSLHQRLRDTASADAMQSGSMGMQAAQRGLERFGSTLNPNALAAQKNMAGLEMAKTRAGSMNAANVAAEDVKWQRNAALTSLASGQGSAAVSGMGSLTGQMAQNRNAQNSMNLQQEQAKGQALSGLGMGAAYLMKKDGGEVRLADGGSPGLTKFQRPSAPSGPSTLDFGSENVSMDKIGTKDIAASIAVPMAAKHLGKAGLSAAKDAVTGAFASSAPLAAGAVPAATEALGTGTALGFGGLGAGATGAGTAAAGTGGAGFAAGLGLTGAGAGAAAGAGTAAATGAAAGTAATVAATNWWNPAGWIAGAALIGKGLDLWADGGDVSRGRKDMRPGGTVKGPGTETSDSIPAWLSDEEFVNNADSVKLPRSESARLVKDWLKEGGTTKELLNEINNAGLRKRGKPPVELAETKNGEVRASMGGLAALGNMARGFVPTAIDMDRHNERVAREDARMAEDKRRWEATDARAQAADARANDMFGLVKQQHQTAMDREAGVRGAFQRAQEDMQGMAGLVTQVRDGKMAPADFIGTVSPAAQKLGITIQKAPTGQWTVMDQGGKPSVFDSDDKLAAYLADPKHSQRRVLAAYQEAAQFDPGMADKAMTMIYKNAEIARNDKEFEAKYGKDGIGGVYGKDGLYDRANQGKIEAALARAEASYNLGLERIEAAQNRPPKPVGVGFFATDSFDKDSPQAVQAHQAYVDMTRRLEATGVSPMDSELRAREMVRGILDSTKELPKGVSFGDYLKRQILSAEQPKANGSEKPADQPADPKSPAAKASAPEENLPPHERGLFARMKRGANEIEGDLKRINEERKRTLEERGRRYAPPGLERVPASM